jgi:hypothetical protein
MPIPVSSVHLYPSKVPLKSVEPSLNLQGIHRAYKEEEKFQKILNFWSSLEADTLP